VDWRPRAMTPSGLFQVAGEHRGASVGLPACTPTSSGTPSPTPGCRPAATRATSCAWLAGSLARWSTATPSPPPNAAPAKPTTACRLGDLAPGGGGSGWRHTPGCLPAIANVARASPQEQLPPAPVADSADVRDRRPPALAQAEYPAGLRAGSVAVVRGTCGRRCVGRARAPRPALAQPESDTGWSRQLPPDLVAR
jgi:hypothetical protein